MAVLSRLYPTNDTAKELDANDTVRTFIREHKKLIWKANLEPKTMIRPSMKILKIHIAVMKIWAKIMRVDKNNKPPPIDYIMEVLRILLTIHAVPFDLADIHRMGWDVKNLCTYIRSLWKRQKSRPVKDKVLVLIRSTNFLNLQMPFDSKITAIYTHI